MTEWRTVPGWERYEVSNSGLVRVKGKKAAKRTYRASTGYEATQLSHNGYKKQMYVHRLVALAFCDGDSGLTVNHIDGNRHNNCSDNLEWVDAATNTQLMHLRRRRERLARMTQQQLPEETAA